MNVAGVEPILYRRYMARVYIWFPYWWWTWISSSCDKR